MTKGWAKQIFSDLIRPSPSSIISAFSPSIRTTARLRLQILMGSEVKFRTSTRRSKNHPPGSVPPAIVQERSGLLNRAMCSWIIAVWYGLVESVFMSYVGGVHVLSLIHISEPTRRTPISYAVFCLKKKKKYKHK